MKPVHITTAPESLALFDGRVRYLRSVGIAVDTISFDRRAARPFRSEARDRRLRVLDLRVEQRRAIAFRYRDAFADIPGMAFMPQAPYGRHTNWLRCFLIDEDKFGCSRDELIGQLDSAGIESRPVWKPMHLQPPYARAERYGGRIAKDLFRGGICLPSSSSSRPDEQFHVINQVIRAANYSGHPHALAEVHSGS